LALATIPFDAVMVKAAQGYGLVKIGENETGTAALVGAWAWSDRSQR
jgi:hypothetical protein